MFYLDGKAVVVTFRVQIVRVFRHFPHGSQKEQPSNIFPSRLSSLLNFHYLVIFDFYKG
jgi:hypothetical protein